jgi:hypothetical protein
LRTEVVEGRSNGDPCTPFRCVCGSEIEPAVLDASEFEHSGIERRAPSVVVVDEIAGVDPDAAVNSFADDLEFTGVTGARQHVEYVDQRENRQRSD